MTNSFTSVASALCITALLFCAYPASSQDRADTEDAALETASIERTLVGRTIAFQNKKGVATAGAMIEFFDADGSVYKWFPGYSTILKGTWSARAFGSVTQQICRHYEDISGTSLPNSRVLKYDCSFLPEDEDKIIAQAGGDVFNLRSSEAPCRLCTSERALSQLESASRTLNQ